MLHSPLFIRLHVGLCALFLGLQPTWAQRVSDQLPPSATPTLGFVARVNGVEIQRAALYELLGQPADKPTALPPESLVNGTNALIEQELLRQASSQLPLAKDPLVQQLVDRAGRQLMGRASLAKRFATVANPSDAQIDQFVREHPHFFAQRQVYRYARLQAILPTGWNAAQLDELIRSQTPLDKLRASLASAGVVTQLEWLSRGSEQIPADELQALQSLQPGAFFRLPSADVRTAVVLRLTAAYPEPRDPQSIRQLIAFGLKQQTLEKLQKDHIEQLLRSAKIALHPADPAVAAKVNEDVISKDLLDQLTRGALVNSVFPVDRVREEVLNGLVNEHLLAQEATKTGIDKDAQIVKALQKLPAEVLANQLVDSRLDKLPLPNPQRIQKYLAENPDYFADRKVFHFSQIMIAKSPFDHFQIAKQELKSLNSVEEISKHLKQLGWDTSVATVWAASDEVNPVFLTELKKLTSGGKTILPAGNAMLAVLVKHAAYAEPMHTAEAERMARFRLAQDDQRAAREELIKQLRSQANIQLAADVQRATELVNSISANWGDMSLRQWLLFAAKTAQAALMFLFPAALFWFLRHTLLLRKTITEPVYQKSPSRAVRWGWWSTRYSFVLPVLGLLSVGMLLMGNTLWQSLPTALLPRRAQLIVLSLAFMGSAAMIVVSYRQYFRRFTVYTVVGDHMGRWWPVLVLFGLQVMAFTVLGLRS